MVSVFGVAALANMPFSRLQLQCRQHGPNLLKVMHAFFILCTQCLDKFFELGSWMFFYLLQNLLYFSSLVCWLQYMYLQMTILISCFVCMYLLSRFVIRLLGSFCKLTFYLWAFVQISQRRTLPNLLYFWRLLIADQFLACRATLPFQGICIVGLSSHVWWEGNSDLFFSQSIFHFFADWRQNSNIIIVDMVLKGILWYVDNISTYM